ncbi:TetR/AcrR family transcriptional regulator [[Mycobacterium] nativiensis]|uniref:TetR/AcrR family transcriptional regulator n=1 Tax=[Mycobacterium] nativiensis TaxID=2855503 RepID=A0ABU5XVJ1_9MYCO|nr:TetR/AcrR family transcriptional regulator [Mycolicibacter sp. MYC340]MEB3032004.1 TetR/AcrR family transcriptional regulator [Mycolicibacter sp. MYC340]
MSAETASKPGLLPKLTGDARVDRWAGHRAAVRADLIEATLRAIDDCGPDLSVDDIIKTAGIPRPKLYRFFHDKDTLFAAVADQVQELIIARVVPRFDVAGTARDLVRSALTAYIDLVDERPNIFRFLVGSHFVDRRSTVLDGGRRLADATVDAVAAVLASRGGDVRNLEYAVDAVLGAVALGVLRWLNDLTISKCDLIAEMTVIVWGALSATAQARGVILNPDDRLSPGDG